MVGAIMETKNILDVNGNIIGTLALPAGTDNATWEAQLALYAYTPPSNPSILIGQVIGGVLVATIGTELTLPQALDYSAYSIYLATGQVCDYVLRIDNLSPVPSIGWTYSNGTFSQPSGG